MSAPVPEMEHHGVLCYVLASAGPLFFMSMQLSYLQTASRMIRLRSDCKLHPLPFISLVTNCTVMASYGYLKANTTVFIPNLTGLLAGILCTVAFQTFTKETKKEFYIVAGIILLLACYFAFNDAPTSLGLIGVGLSVVLMGSPLATLASVIKDKSTHSLPFLTSLATFFNALSWALYGIIEANDPIIYVPNLIGLFLACIQLSLFVIYGIHTDPPEALKYEEITSDTERGNKIGATVNCNNIKMPLVDNEQKVATYV
jgi:uncharacterized protein with PQ loop repeat